MSDPLTSDQRAQVNRLWQEARAAYLTAGPSGYAEPIAQMRVILRAAGVSEDGRGRWERQAAYRERERRRRR